MEKALYNLYQSEHRRINESIKNNEDSDLMMASLLSHFTKKNLEIERRLKNLESLYDSRLSETVDVLSNRWQVLHRIIELAANNYEIRKRNEVIACTLLENIPIDELNKRNRDGYTPLMLAVFSSMPRLVRRLKLAGADVNLADSYGNTAIHYAIIMEDYESLVALVFYLKGKERVFINRLRKQRQQIVASKSRAFISNGIEDFSTIKEVNLDQKNNESKTPVYLAVESGQIRMVESLVVFGADSNIAENESGMTPLHLAVLLRNRNLVIALVNGNQEININAQMHDGRTALSIALDSYNCDDCLINFLKANGAGESYSQSLRPASVENLCAAA